MSFIPYPTTTLVLPGSLPPEAQQAHLRSYAQEKAPTLFHWLQSAPRTELNDLPETIACSSHEYWILQQLGFSADQANAWASAWLGVQSIAWLAYPCHLAIGQDISIQPVTDLGLAEAEALLLAIQPVLASYRHQACVENPNAWNWAPPSNFEHACCSLDALMQPHAWRVWADDARSAGWRRLLADIQIIWHQHPINIHREANGQLPINMLWLLGESASWTPAPIPLFSNNSPFNHIPSVAASNSTEAIYVDTDLRIHALNDDWGAWLEHWAVLERNYLSPVETGFHKKTIRKATIVLSNEEQYGIIQLQAPKLPWLRSFQHFFHAKRQPLWWSAP